MVFVSFHILICDFQQGSRRPAHCCARNCPPDSQNTTHPPATPASPHPSPPANGRCNTPHMPPQSPTPHSPAAAPTPTGRAIHPATPHPVSDTAVNSSTADSLPHIAPSHPPSVSPHCSPVLSRFSNLYHPCPLAASCTKKENFLLKNFGRTVNGYSGWSAGAYPPRPPSIDRCPSRSRPLSPPKEGEHFSLLSQGFEHCSNSSGQRSARK